MNKNNLKRFLASLLAVLMLSQVTGVAPGVFAAGNDAAAQSEESAAPILRDGEAVIPEGSDAGTVKKILAKSLISNYDQLDPDSRDNLDWEFECVGWQKGDVAHKLDSNTVFGDINGFESHKDKKIGFVSTTLYFQHNALASQADGSYKVRLKSNPDAVVLLSKVAKLSSNIVANENVSVKLAYNDDGTINYDNINEAVFNAAVKSSTPSLTVKDVTITYEATATTGNVGNLGKEWMPLKGGEKNLLTYPGVTEGIHKVRIEYPENDTYYGAKIELDINFLGREASAITFNENPTVKIQYNDDLSIKLPEFKAAIWENVVDSTTPADLSTANVSIKYYAKAESGSLGELGHAWADLNGEKINGLTYPAISEGKRTLRFEFAGNANYKGFSKDVEVTFTGRDPAFELIKGVTEIDAKFADAKNLDTEAIANEIRNVLVEKLATDESIKLSDVKVEYKTSRIGSYKVLDKNASLDADDIGDTIHLRLSWGDGKGTAQYKPFEATVDIKLVDNRIPSVVALVDVANITYNMDASKMIEEIIKNAIDSANSTLPADYKASDFTVKYYNADEDKWLPIGGLEKDIKAGILKDYPHINAGDGQKILVTYNGSKDYKPSAAVEGTLNVAKADVKVSMKLLTSVLAGQKVNKDVLKVTLDPNDPELDLYIVFVGFNTYKEKTIYVKLTEDQEKVIDFISDTQKGFPLYYKEEQTIRGKLNEGMTVDEFITYVDELMKNDTIKSALEKNGIDAEMLQNIVTALKSINKVTGDLRIAIGSPKHAGLYQAFAVAVNKNYNTGVGTGTVIVAMNAAGMKLEPNTELKKQTITVSEAEKYKKGEKAVATLTCDGDASDIDQSCIHYRFTGLSNIYSSHDFPTAPGKYIVTVSVRGGDYYALPTTFTFTVKAD